MTIKAVLFDCDGVLTTERNDAYSTCRFLNAATKIPQNYLEKVYMAFFPATYINKGNDTAVIQQFCDRIGMGVNLDMVMDSFRKTPKNEGMFELADGLRKNGYRTGIVTDNSETRIKVIIDSFQLRDFYPIIVSVDVGCRKRG